MSMGRESNFSVENVAYKSRDSQNRLAPLLERHLVLIEPRQIFLQCLTECLSGPGSRFKVCGYATLTEMEYDWGESEAIGLLLSVPSEIWAMEHLADVIQLGRKNFPTLPIIVLADSEDPDFIRSVIGLGARGYVPASFGLVALKEVIFLVHAGEIFVPASVLRQGLDQVKLRFHGNYFITQAEHAAATAPKAPDASLLAEGVAALEEAKLTRREREVLSLVRDGKPNKLIARELAICEGTVKAHVQRIMRKLRVKNRTQVALAAADLSSRR
jgi:DNA-binding NarL/FixJ family response regulator